MTRLLILVEGQSEEVFAKRTLAPHLAAFGVYASVTVLRTKRIMSGGAFRGGVTSYAKIRQNLLELLGDRNARVTTLLDFYGLPEDFPGRAAVLATPGLTAHDKAIRLQQAFADDIDQARFMPFSPCTSSRPGCSADRKPSPNISAIRHWLRHCRPSCNRQGHRKRSTTIRRHTRPHASSA